MLCKEELLELRKSYIEIGKLVQNYGNGQFNIPLKLLMGQINCIDSTEEECIKSQYLIQSYKSLFMQKGMLSDFIIYHNDYEIRNQLNIQLKLELECVWNIMKSYVL